MLHLAQLWVPSQARGHGDGPGRGQLQNLVRHMAGGPRRQRRHFAPRGGAPDGSRRQHLGGAVRLHIFLWIGETGPAFDAANTAAYLMTFVPAALLLCLRPLFSRTGAVKRGRVTPGEAAAGAPTVCSLDA